MANRKLKLILSFLVVVIVALLIFGFSAQTGAESGRLSRAITEWLLNHFVPGFSAMAAERQRELLRTGQLIVRKTAHFSEYALLAISTMLFLHYALEKRRPVHIAAIAWVAATLYACTDEFHQMFVSNRGPAITDVCIDSGGAIFGALVATAVLILRLRHKARA